MSASPALAPILLHMRTEPSRTWSLILTLFGDMVLPRGGRLWLGTVLDILAGLDIGGNVVRTAMSRLAADGWLERHRVGRNSYYRFAEKGGETFAAAASRIYAAQQPAWDGAFSLAILDGADRDAAKPALEAAGFAPLGPGVFLALAAAPPIGDAVLLRAVTDPTSARRLAAQAWPIARLGDGYRRFLDAFRGLPDQFARGGGVSGLDAPLCRLLLIHFYRRLVLRDPLLPEALAPDGWPGHAARALCADLYRVLLPASERWLDAHALTDDGPLPAPGPDLARRFRGG